MCDQLAVEIGLGASRAKGVDQPQDESSQMCHAILISVQRRAARVARRGRADVAWTLLALH
jgi:hypothetical protein